MEKKKNLQFIFSVQLTRKYTELSKDIHQEAGLKHSFGFLIIPKHLKVKFKLIIATKD